VLPDLLDLTDKDSSEWNLSEDEDEEEEEESGSDEEYVPGMRSQLAYHIVVFAILQASQSESIVLSLCPLCSDKYIHTCAFSSVVRASTHTES
jgi:hypothetical protein